MTAEPPTKFRLPPFEPGNVWLVGTGTGVPELLPLLALYALREADVVFHDSGSDEAIVALTPADRWRPIPAGGGPRQLVDQLVDRSTGGQRVVRLYTGDPLYFGGAIGDIVELARRGVDYRIVPGNFPMITRMIQGGIPVTYRDRNTAVTFVRVEDDPSSSLDWSLIARSAPMLAIEVVAGQWSSVVRRLLAAGLAPDHPMALVGSGGEPEVFETSLGAWDRVRDATRRVNPELLVVGRSLRLLR